MEQATSRGIPILFQKTITIVIPAYNEEEAIGKSLDEVGSYISDNDLKWSIVVSVDGDDDTDKIVAMYSKKFPFISMSKSSGRGGKGAAVKRVIDSLDSEYVILMDADGSISFESIVNGLCLLADSDCLIFSRYSNHNRIPLFRRFLSRGFNVLVRASLGLRIMDTQSGYKIFRTEQFVKAMRKVETTDAFWDVSLLYHLSKEGAKIKEIGCHYDHRKEGKFHPMNLVAGFAISLVAFRIRHSRFNRYVPEAFVSLYRRKFRST